MSTASDVAAAQPIVDGPMPKHAQLREILRRAIERDLPPGCPIPSERELAERYAVSRLTVRSAVGKLVEEGLLSRIRGKGTFTAARRMELQLQLMSFTDEMSKRGMRPASELLGAAVAVPPEPVATALRLGEGEQAIRVRRLRKADGLPLAVERGWYSERAIPGLLELDLTGSLYAQLATRHGIRFDRAWQTVWAEAADRDNARLLGVPTGSSLLVFRRVSSARGEPMEDMTSWYRGEAYQVSMQLERENGGNP